MVHLIEVLRRSYFLLDPPVEVIILLTVEVSTYKTGI